MYRQKTYRCGKAVYIEKTQTRVYKKGEVREKRRKPTPQEKQEENDRAAERRLARKIAANFTGEDLWITLTYRKDERPSPQEAKGRLKKFITGLREDYRKAGYELKYIIVTEYQGKSIHHHAIINGIPDAAKLIRGRWRHGRPDFKMMDESGEYSELASYIIKETAKTFRDPGAANRQRYTCSRNLIIPEPEVKRVSAKTFRKQPKPWKGYELLKGSLVQGISAVTGYMYQYYTMIKTEEEEDGETGGCRRDKRRKDPGWDPEH